MTKKLTGAALYGAVARESSVVVIGRYSTSFSAASSLLGRQIRGQIGSVYALVRLADEIVDGVADAYGLDDADVLAALDELEAETDRAVLRGYSTNLVVHAFAETARQAGFGVELTAPFFESMRADCSKREHTPDSFEQYVYGSAEVVGLMCLAVFLAAPDATTATATRAELVAGARRLGAALQKINFLRDLAADSDGLGRSYFPGVDPAHLGEAERDRLVADAADDLSASAPLVAALPRSSRKAVALAHSLFAELNRRIAQVPAERLRAERIRVPNAVKLRLAAAAAAGAMPR